MGYIPATTNFHFFLLFSVCVSMYKAVNSTPTLQTAPYGFRTQSEKAKNVNRCPFPPVYRDLRIMWWQQIEKHLHLLCWLQLPCLETRDACSTSTPLSASHRSEALRLGQRAINLLKCHFQREMDCRGGRRERRSREVEGKISEDKQPA